MPVSPCGTASKARWLRTAAKKTGISPPGTTLAKVRPTTIWTGENKESAPGLGKGADEGADAGGVDFAGAFQGGADDESGGFRQIVLDIFEGGAAAKEKRGAGGSGVGAAKVIGIRAVAGPGAAENERVSAAPLPGIAGFVLDRVTGREGGRVFDVHIRKDADPFRADAFAETEKFLGDAVQDALIGEAGTDENIDADEIGSGGRGDRHGADAVVTKEVDPERPGKNFASFTSKGGETGHGGRAGRFGGEGGIAKVFEDDGVASPLFQGKKITTHGLANRFEFAGVAGGPGKSGKMDDAKETSFGHQTGDEIFARRHFARVSPKRPPEPNFFVQR